MRWQKNFKQWLNQKVDITINDQTCKGRILKFVGINTFKHKVIITGGQGIFYVDNWNELNIVPFVDERIFKEQIFSEEE